jgi:predicted transcriptional regulator
MKHRVASIHRSKDQGHPATGRRQPSVGFSSTATITAVLSEDNRVLPRMIRDWRPKSLMVLAGRRVPNLSRSLRMMEGYGLVKLKHDGYSVEPVALATRFKILID